MKKKKSCNDDLNDMSEKDNLKTVDLEFLRTFKGPEKNSSSQDRAD